MSNVFELQEANNELVVLKVNADDPLTVAMNPYLSSDMAYISITRGKEHVFTVIRKDGTTWNFHWGDSGYTLIGDGTKFLKRKVVDFIENECHILLGLKGGKIKSAKIFYNSNFSSWQLTIADTNGGIAYWHNDKVNSFEEMANASLPYTGHCTVWNHTKISIDCWEAVL